jgi:hypothetical protein
MLSDVVCAGGFHIRIMTSGGSSPRTTSTVHPRGELNPKNAAMSASPTIQMPAIPFFIYSSGMIAV